MHKPESVISTINICCLLRNIATIAVFYALPVIQLVITYQTVRWRSLSVVVALKELQMISKSFQHIQRKRDSLFFRWSTLLGTRTSATTTSCVPTHWELWGGFCSAAVLGPVDTFILFVKPELFWCGCSIYVNNSHCSLWNWRFLSPGLRVKVFWGFTPPPLLHPQTCETNLGCCSQKCFCTDNRESRVFFVLLKFFFQLVRTKPTTPSVQRNVNVFTDLEATVILPTDPACRWARLWKLECFYCFLFIRPNNHWKNTNVSRGRSRVNRTLVWRTSTLLTSKKKHS